MSAERTREQIRAWIVSRNDRLAASDIRDDTPLLKQGLITSLQLLDFIFFIEELSGRVIAIDQIKPGSFQDLNVIMREFFGDV